MFIVIIMAIVVVVAAAVELYSKHVHLINSF